MNDNPMISASLLCANVFELPFFLKIMEKNNVEYLHMDVFDGHFAKNLGFPPNILQNIRKITTIPFDIHLCVSDPENMLHLFDIMEKDIVSVHVEATPHIQRVLQMIKAAGAYSCVALNPGTPLGVLDYLWDVVDVVLVMTVNPGFAGQKLVDSTLKKIRDLKKIIRDNKLNIKIEVDGNVSFENATKMANAGADIFVAGTSSIFNQNISLEEGIKKLRKAIMMGLNS